MSKVPDREAAMQRVQRTLQELTMTRRLPKAGGKHAAPEVIDYVKEAATNPDNLEAGQLLTPFLQLPPVVFAVLAPCLKGETPYSEKNLGVVITVKNDSAKTIEVMYDRDYRPKVVRDSVGWVSGDTGYFVDHVKKLKPGEEIDLLPHYAILALSEHAMSGNPPMLWGESGAIPQYDDLVEVAYRMSVAGPDGVPINSRNYQPDTADDEEGSTSSSRRGRRRNVA